MRNGLTAIAAKIIAILTIGAALLAAHQTASADEIVEVRSASGVTAWLKREPAIPMIALQAHWAGAGAVSDPEGQEGRSGMVAALLDEGAGDLDSQAFQQRLDDFAIRMSFENGRDGFSLSLQTLTQNADEAFRMTGLALTEPRFDAEPVERIRAQVLSGIARSSRNPNSISGKTFAAAFFGGHPYGDPVEGTLESVPAITAASLKAHVANGLAKDNLIVGVVGDITAEALKPLLDTAFGDLPATSGLTAGAPAPAPETGALSVIDYAGPQTVFTFGLPGIRRTDPDFDTARVMNHMLGGGGFSSLLTEEIRVKRGLTYGVYSYLRPLELGGQWLGGLSTSNDKAAEALNVLKDTVARFRESGPTGEQLEKAKANINGAFPLRFTSNSAIASLLVAMQRYDLGKDYMQRRPERINAVTVEDVRRVARRILDLDRLVVVAVGRPEGLPPAGQ